MTAKSISLTYSVADQDFARTKSVGILNVSLQLLEHLTRHPDVGRIAVLANSTLASRIRRHDKVALHRREGPSAGRLGRIFWDQVQIYGEAKKLGAPWLFLPKGFSSFLRGPPARLATYVHDVIPQYYDEKYPRALSRLERWYFRASFGATLRQSSIVFTNSEFTRSEVARVARLRGIPVPHIVVAGIGFDPPSGFSESGREGVIALSSRLPHKRTDLAVEYLAKWQTETRYQGPVHWIGRPPPSVRFPDFANWRSHSRVPEDEYRSLMARARVLVYFSDYEGFGMPPVEALAAGVTPVFSRLPATTEVMKGTGHEFENQSYPSFARAMKEALAAPKELIGEWATTVLKAHEWRAVTERVVAGLLARESASEEMIA